MLYIANQKRQRNSRHKNRNKKGGGSSKPSPVVEGGGEDHSPIEGGRAKQDMVMSPGSGSDGGMIMSPMSEDNQSPTGT
jgi:hypothetical protein